MRPKLISLDYNGRRYENFEADALLQLSVPQAAIDAAGLLIAQTTALAMIDAAAAKAFGRHTTTVFGPSLLYARKLAEAKAYQDAAAAKSPNGIACPLLTAEASAGAQTVADVASAVIAADAAFIAISAQIEAIRVPAKRAVRSSTTADAANALAVGVVAALAKI